MSKRSVAPDTERPGNSFASRERGKGTEIAWIPVLRAARYVITIPRAVPRAVSPCTRAPSLGRAFRPLRENYRYTPRTRESFCTGAPRRCESRRDYRASICHGHRFDASPGVSASIVAIVIDVAAKIGADAGSLSARSSRTGA